MHVYTHNLSYSWQFSCVRLSCFLLLFFFLSTSFFTQKDDGLLSFSSSLPEVRVRIFFFTKKKFYFGIYFLFIKNGMECRLHSLCVSLVVKHAILYYDHVFELLLLLHKQQQEIMNTEYIFLSVCSYAIVLHLEALICFIIFISFQKIK